MTSAFLALQLWLGRAGQGDSIISSFRLTRSFQPSGRARAEVGLIIHEGQLTYQNEGLVGLRGPGDLVGARERGLAAAAGRATSFTNASRRRRAGPCRKCYGASIQFSLDHRAEAVQHALQYARDMGRDLADKFVGMYVNHWTLDYGERGRESIRRFLGRGFERGLLPRRQELEFVQ